MLPLSLLICGLMAATPAERAIVHACIDASSRGQELRDRGDLLGARNKFRACATDACPQAIRSDCTRWEADVDQAVPSVSVAVRDGSVDLVGVHVSVDGVPVPADGRSLEVNPGRHQLEISKAGATKREMVLVVAGERNRLLVISWPGASLPKTTEASPVAASEAPQIVATPAAPRPGSRHVAGPLTLGLVGLASLGTFIGVGLSGQGDLNALESSPCGQARSCQPGATNGVQTKYVVADVALGVGIASLLGGLIWFLIPSKPDGTAGLSVASDGRSLSLGGTF